jgi:hypothetical protein
MTNDQLPRQTRDKLEKEQLKRKGVFVSQKRSDGIYLAPGDEAMAYDLIAIKQVRKKRLRNGWLVFACEINCSPRQARDTNTSKIDNEKTDWCLSSATTTFDCTRKSTPIGGTTTQTAWCGAWRLCCFVNLVASVPSLPRQIVVFQTTTVALLKLFGCLLCTHTGHRGCAGRRPVRKMPLFLARCLVITYMLL